MKLTNTRSLKRKSGMTLLELTVVILVLLSLISILFVGARAWKKGSDRAGCILNIRNTQQAVRGHMNMNPSAAAPADTVIFGTSGYLKNPTCPSDAAKTFATSYTYAVTDVGVGKIFLTCKIDATGHLPDTTTSADW